MVYFKEKCYREILTLVFIWMIVSDAMLCISLYHLSNNIISQLVLKEWRLIALVQNNEHMERQQLKHCFHSNRMHSNNFSLVNECKEASIKASGLFIDWSIGWEESARGTARPTICLDIVVFIVYNHPLLALVPILDSSCSINYTKQDRRKHAYTVILRFMSINDFTSNSHLVSKLWSILDHKRI